MSILEEPFKQLGEQINRFPHVVIGKDSPPGKPIPIQTPTQPSNNKEEEWINKLKKWGMIISIMFVVAYAVYRILFG